MKVAKGAKALRAVRKAVIPVIISLFFFFVSALAPIESPEAPSILSIKFPDGTPSAANCAGGAQIKTSDGRLVNLTPWIPADGTKCNGTVEFKDPNGANDLVKVIFQLIEARAEFEREISFAPDVKVNPTDPTRGSLQFVAFTQSIQNVRHRVMLEDKKGNRSQPKEFFFKAVGPEPVIAAMDFPEKPCPFPTSLTEICPPVVRGTLEFIDREGDITNIQLLPENAVVTVNVTEGVPPGATCTPQQPCVFSLPAAQNQREGMLEFFLFSSDRKRVRIHLNLIDNKNNQIQREISIRDRLEYVAAIEVAPNLFSVLPLRRGGGTEIFKSPFHAVIDNRDNSIYVADTENHRIQKLDPNGGFLGKWGNIRCDLSTGSGCTLNPAQTNVIDAKANGDGQFNSPQRLAIEGSGNVYVVDTKNHRIQKFDATKTDPTSGNLIVKFLLKWGSLGTGDGQFNSPGGVAIDGAGNVYVADTKNHRIQKFSADGRFLLKWGSFCDLATRSGCTDPDGPGPLNVGDGQFNSPEGVAVDPTGNVYVTDTGNHRIQKFRSDGTFIFALGSRGNGDGQFESPSGVALDGAGNLYVADTGNDRVQSIGLFLIKWGRSVNDEAKLTGPKGVALDSSGNVYVADTGSHQIKKFGRID